MLRVYIDIYTYKQMCTYTPHRLETKMLPAHKSRGSMFRLEWMEQKPIAHIPTQYVQMYIHMYTYILHTSVSQQYIYIYTHMW